MFNFHIHYINIELIGARLIRKFTLHLNCIFILELSFPSSWLISNLHLLSMEHHYKYPRSLLSNSSSCCCEQIAWKI
uniref:Alpha-carbonic anhydrase domain-containing protein n=1 Tax=Onchocerca volvulus TaxID=6282 RepID=A0A8R1Y330_ONCVO